PASTATAVGQEKPRRAYVEYERPVAFKVSIPPKRYAIGSPAKKTKSASTAMSVVAPAVELSRPRSRGRTGDIVVSAPRPARRKRPPATHVKIAARSMRPISSPIDHLRKSKTLPTALEKTASALAKRSANMTRNGKAGARPTPTA